MTTVSISKAAKLVRRGRASIYRDIDKGRLSKTVSPSGETGIDTSELVRVYGKLYFPETSAAEDIENFASKVDTWTRGKTVSNMPHETPGDSIRAAVLDEKIRAYEHRIALLERIAHLEAVTRKETAAALQAQLADKDILIKALQNQNQMLLLEYTKPAPTEPKEKTATKKKWWARLLHY